MMYILKKPEQSSESRPAVLIGSKLDVLFFHTSLEMPSHLGASEQTLKWQENDEIHNV